MIERCYLSTSLEPHEILNTILVLNVLQMTQLLLLLPLLSWVSVNERSILSDCYNLCYFSTLRCWMFERLSLKRLLCLLCQSSSLSTTFVICSIITMVLVYLFEKTIKFSVTKSFSESCNFCTAILFLCWCSPLRWLHIILKSF